MGFMMGIQRFRGVCDVLYIWEGSHTYDLTEKQLCDSMLKTKK